MKPIKIKLLVVLAFTILLAGNTVNAQKEKKGKKLVKPDVS